MEYKYNLADETVPDQLMPLINDFIQDRITELKSFEQFIEKNNFEEIRKVAHKWKGFSAPYGFNFLEKCAIELSHLCKEEKPLEIKSMIPIIKQYLKEKNDQS